jgi:uncharacterized membrane protein YdbT with pleckstrin-like domain
VIVPFPRRLLAEDEEVVLDLHPHWKRLLLPALLVPIAIGIGTYVVFLVPSGSVRTPLRLTIVGVAVLVLLRWSVWPWIVWQTTRYVLTNRRVVIRTGVLGRSGRDIPLTRVNDVSFHHSLLERMLRCGTLTIESAGEHGQVVLPEVPDVELVQREVYRCVEAEAHRLSADRGTPP